MDLTSHKLFIDGDTSDTVQLIGSDTWNFAGIDATSFAGHVYRIYTYDSGSNIEKLLIENPMAVM